MSLEVGTLLLGRTEANDGHGDAYVDGQWLAIKFDGNSAFVVLEHLYEDEHGRQVVTLLALHNAYKFPFRGSVENVDKMCEVIVRESGSL